MGFAPDRTVYLLLPGSYPGYESWSEFISLSEPHPSQMQIVDDGI